MGIALFCTFERQVLFLPPYVYREIHHTASVQALLATYPARRSPHLEGTSPIMSTPTSPQQDRPMPTRTATSTTDDNEPIPEEDSSEVTRLLQKRRGRRR